MCRIIVAVAILYLVPARFQSAVTESWTLLISRKSKSGSGNSWFRFDCAYAFKFKNVFWTCVERATTVTNPGSPSNLSQRFRILGANQKYRRLSERDCCLCSRVLHNVSNCWVRLWHKSSGENFFAARFLIPDVISRLYSQLNFSLLRREGLNAWDRKKWLGKIYVLYFARTKGRSR